MSDDQTLNRQVGTIAIVIVIAMVLLNIQSCEDNHFNEYSNEQIIQVGRERFLQESEDSSKIKITRESVIRPGRDGGDFGYLAQYLFLADDGEWIEREHYEE